MKFSAVAVASLSLAPMGASMVVPQKDTFRGFMYGDPPEVDGRNVFEPDQTNYRFRDNDQNNMRAMGDQNKAEDGVLYRPGAQGGVRPDLPRQGGPTVPQKASLLPPDETGSQNSVEAELATPAVTVVPSIKMASLLRPDSVNSGNGVAASAAVVPQLKKDSVLMPDFVDPVNRDMPRPGSASAAVIPPMQKGNVLPPDAFSPESEAGMASSVVPPVQTGSILPPDAYSSNSGNDMSASVVPSVPRENVLRPDALGSETKPKPAMARPVGAQRVVPSAQTPNLLQPDEINGQYQLARTPATPRVLLDLKQARANKADQPAPQPVLYRPVQRTNGVSVPQEMPNSRIWRPDPLLGKTPTTNSAPRVLYRPTPLANGVDQYQRIGLGYEAPTPKSDIFDPNELRGEQRNLPGTASNVEAQLSPQAQIPMPANSAKSSKPVAAPPKQTEIPPQPKPQATQTAPEAPGDEFESIDRFNEYPEVDGATSHSTDVWDSIKAPGKEARKNSDDPSDTSVPEPLTAMNEKQEPKGSGAAVAPAENDSDTYKESEGGDDTFVADLEGLDEDEDDEDETKPKKGGKDGSKKTSVDEDNKTKFKIREREQEIEEKLNKTPKADAKKKTKKKAPVAFASSFASFLSGFPAFW